MKWSARMIVALVCVVLAGQSSAQTAVDAYRKAGSAYFKAGQFRESVKAYQDVIRLAPNDTDAYQQLGEAYTRLNMNKEAAESFEKLADLLLSGNGAPASPRTPPVTQTAQNATPRVQPQAPAAIGQHKVGERVDYVDSGVWRKAVIILTRDDSADHLDGKIYAPYRIHPIGDNLVTDRWVCCLDFADFRSQLRPAGTNRTEPIPGGEANDEVLKAMRGDPTALAEPSPALGYVARMPPTGGGATPATKQYDCGVAAAIAITGKGTYRGGTYTFDAPSSTLTFHGGDYDGQRAVYEASGGLSRLHLLGPSGRPVIDCD